MTPSHDPLDPTPRQVAISTQHRRSSTPSDKPFHQNDKTVSYYKAAPSPRLPVQTTTVEIVSIPNPTHVKTPASHLDANLSQHSSHVSSHKPPFVVQQHPQNPWHGMSPVRDARLTPITLNTETVPTGFEFEFIHGAATARIVASNARQLTSTPTPSGDRASSWVFCQPPWIVRCRSRSWIE